MRPASRRQCCRRPDGEPPVGFAIIAALEVEREAIVRRFEGVVKVQDDGEPLTYYVGAAPIPGRTGRTR
jgi:hypothetical protein